MSFRKYVSPKHSFQSTNSKLDKLEKTQKSELRMISTAAFKFRSKFMKVDDSRGWRGENEASTLRMYETHFPGFCYLRDGKCRRKVMNVNKRATVSVESSEKIKALLFTDNELDINKVLCLHLLGTHVQNRRHIQRKDGRFCMLVRSHNQGHKRLAVQSVSHRTVHDKKVTPTANEEILPRYILEVRLPDRAALSAEADCHMDDDAGKKKLPQIPVYVNNDIQAIISSVVEALKIVNSSKLTELIDLARDPDKLKNIFSREDAQQYVTQLGGSHLVVNPTAYDVIMTHPVFEKAPDSSSTEIVSQILDLAPNSDMRNMLNILRKSISPRCEEMVVRNVFPGKKKRIQGGKGSVLRSTSKTSFKSCDTSTNTSYSGVKVHKVRHGSGGPVVQWSGRYLAAIGFASGALSSECQFVKYSADSNEILKHEDGYQVTAPNETKIDNSNLSLQKGMIRRKKVGPRSPGSVIQRSGTQESSQPFSTLEEFQKGEKSTLSDRSPNKIEAKIHQFTRLYDSEIYKYDLKNLNNSQRILLGLKIAGMKSKPVNMHQFENKKQVDVISLITSIMRPNKPDPNANFSVKDDPDRRKAKKTVQKVGHYQVQGLGNLTRTILSNLRHEIATAENKKRVKEFIQAPL